MAANVDLFSENYFRSLPVVMKHTSEKLKFTAVMCLHNL
jgi:hypothetical protein